MTKQTAVQWLAKQIELCGDPIGCEISWQELDELVKQAKEIEKEQIINAYKSGINAGLGIAIDIQAGKDSDELAAEQYYNETYNKTK